MSLNNIPFYITYESYIKFIETNFNMLTLTDDAKFIGYILVQILFFICLFLLIKIFKFVVVFIINKLFP